MENNFQAALDTLTQQTEGEQPALEQTTEQAPEQTTEQALEQAEPAPEENKAETQRQELLSRQIAVNQRLDRQVRELSQKLKEATNKEPEIDPELKNLAELKKNAKFDPIAYLEAAGISYDDITEYQLNGGRPTVSKDVYELKEQIQNMKKENETLAEQRQREAQEREYAAQVSEIKAEIVGKKEDYPLITAFADQYSLVKDVMQEAEKNGDELSHFDAAKMVENHLQGEFDKQFSMIKNIPFVREKIKAELALTENTAHNDSNNPQNSTEAAPNNTNTNRLTNKMNQVAGTDTHRPLTDEERRQKAASLLQFD